MAKVFYIVEGSGDFPFFMLALDKAYPRSCGDAISSAISGTDSGDYQRFATDLLN